MPEILDIPWSVLCFHGISCIGKEETISFLPSLFQGLPSWSPVSASFPPHNSVTEISKMDIGSHHSPASNFWNSYGPPAEIILTPWCIMTLLWPCSLISHHFSILSSIQIILKSFSLTRWAILSYVSATCQDLLPPFKPLPTSFSSFLPVTTYMAQALTCLGNSQPPQFSTLAEFLAQRALFVLVGWQN